MKYFLIWLAVLAVCLFILGSFGWVGPVEFLLLGLATIVFVAFLRSRSTR